MVKVSVITPTYQREDLLLKAIECFQNQTFTDTEMLILDDSPEKSQRVLDQAEKDSRIKYRHVLEKINNGQKRNLLIREASGEIIAHFDDDDYYAPTYLETMLEQLGDNALVKLSGWYNYSPKDKSLCYWDTTLKSKLHYHLGPKGPLKVISADALSQQDLFTFVWGYGFSYVYRKSVFDKVTFQDSNFGSDFRFMGDLVKAGYKGVAIRDETGICVHMIHAANVSSIYPQYLLPEFYLTRIFGPDIEKYTLADMPTQEPEEANRNN
jgi:glycosyltransferase involved in cell wall biosynthesis